MAWVGFSGPDRIGGLTGPFGDAGPSLPAEDDPWPWPETEEPDRLDGPFRQHGDMWVAADPITRPDQITFHLFTDGTERTYTLLHDGRTEETLTSADDVLVTRDTADGVWEVRTDAGPVPCLITDESGMAIAENTVTRPDSPCVYDPAVFTFR